MDTHFDAAAGLSGVSDLGAFGSIVGIGDINGDGYSDILVGAPNYQWFSNKGYFVILLGSKYIPVTAVNEPKNILPQKFTLLQNYPNPFNPSTTISYILSTPSKILLSVYNILGQKLNDLVNEEQTSGTHQVNFDASGYPSETYFYKLTATDAFGKSQSETKSMLLIK